MIKKELICPIYEIRENVLEIEKFKQMFNHEYRDKCSNLLELRNLISAKSDDFSIKLEQKVKNESDDSKRKILINLKRDLYNQRKRVLESINSNSQYLKQIGIFEEALEIAKLISERIEDEKNIKDYYANAYQVERSKMRSIFLESPLLMNALKYVSPVIISKARSYFSEESHKHKAKIRKLDYTLLKVLSRGATKMSPFSTLNKVSFGSMGNNVALGYKNESIIKASISCTFILRVWEKLQIDFSVIEDSSFYMNETIVKEDGIFYWTTLEDKINTRKKIFATSDTLNKLSVNSIVDYIFENYGGNKKKYFSYKEISDEIACHFKLEISDCNKILIQLIERKFILNALDLIENRNIVNNLINILEDITEKSKRVNYAIEKLKKMEENLVLLNEDIIKSNTYYFNILEEAQKLVEVLEIEGHDQKYVLYQDYIGCEVNNSKILNDKIFEELFLLQFFMKIFDSELRLNYIIADHIYRKYGDGLLPLDNTEKLLNDIINIIISVSKELLNTVYVKEDVDAYSDFEEVKSLIIAKNQLIKYLKNNKNKEKIVIDKGLVDELLETTNSIKEYRASNDFFIQKDGENIIVNHMYYGYMTYFLRFLDYMPEILKEQKVCSYIDEVITKNNIVDMYNKYGFNANIRPAITKKSIDIPNTHIKERAEFEQIYSFDEIEIKYSQQTKRMDLYIEGEKVKIMYLGSLVKRLLPSLVATLNAFCNNGVSENNISYIFLTDYLEKGNMNGINIIPEIKFMEHVILSRKKTIVGRDVLERIFEKPDEEALYEFNVFCLSNNIPEEFFAYKLSEEKAYQNEKIYPIFEKPQYFNSNSMLFWKLFRNDFEKSNFVIFESARPSTLDDMKEYVVEITS